MRQTVWAACMAGAWLASVSIPAHAQGGRLNLDEARAYLLELINRDRASLELSPVTLDPVATAAGQRHAEEMAANQYLSHWDLAGEMPDERYTAAGGTDCVHENVLLRAHHEGDEPAGTLTVERAPTFTRTEIETIEAAYFNQVPPNDAHRRNIIEPMHTGVGIGLARAAGLTGDALANTQEFTDHYVAAGDLPRAASLGGTVEVKGRVLPGATFRGISIGRSGPPEARTVAQLKQTGAYRVPAPSAWYLPGDDGPGRSVRSGPDGSFRADVRFSDEKRPGVYYLSIWVSRRDQSPFVASRRTVVVR